MTTSPRSRAEQMGRTLRSPPRTYAGNGGLMPLNGVNLGAIKERAEAARLTPSSTLTDSLVSAKERLMFNPTIPRSHVYRRILRPRLGDA